MDSLDSLVGLYAIVLGILVVGWWAIAYARDRIPELRSEPWAIRLRLLAEAMLALTVVAGGVMVLSDVKEGSRLLLVGFGMVLYSLVVGAGHSIQRRERAPVLVFAVLFLVTALAASVIVLSPTG